MQPGWGNLFRVAQAWSELMSRLGYDRYGAQGTDAGSGVAGMLAMMADGLGFLHLQATRPQTLAYSLADSPVGQLAWIVEKFHEWTDPAADRPEGAVDRDQLLTNVSISWFRGAGPSSAHATYEGMQVWRAMAAQESGWGGEGEAEHVRPPTGVAVFAADTTIRSVMDPSGTIAHWSEFDTGGHFPAMGVPDLLAGDIRAFFRSLRKSADSAASPREIA